MNEADRDEQHPDELRQRAEERMQEAGQLHAPDHAGVTPQRLLNELRVHQAELELQNEELQRIRDELEVSNRQYSELYDFAPSGYVTLDFDGTITLANLAAAQILGTERSRLVGRRLRSFVAPEDEAALSSWFRGVVDGAEPTPCVIQLAGTDERTLVVQLTATRSVERSECRLLLVDITTRVQAEAARRAAQLLQQQQIFERFTDPTYLVDVDDGPYRVSGVNSAFIEWTGLRRDEVIGKSASHWMQAESFEVAQAKFDEAVSSGVAIRYEDVSTGPAGDHLAAQVTVVPIVAEDGSCYQLLCSVHDITAERRARTELEDERRRHLDRLAMLEKFHTLTVGRELRMVELKQEVAQLEGRIQVLEQQLAERDGHESRTGRT